MSKINLDNGTIQVGDKWLTADQLKSLIQEKIDSGEMKFASLAVALEELNKAVENSHTLEVRLVLPKAEYEKFIALAGVDEIPAVRKAILAYINSDPSKTEPKTATAPKTAKPAAPKATPSKPGTMPCKKCNKPVRISSDKRPIEIECQFCGTTMIIDE